MGRKKYSEAFYRDKVRAIWQRMGKHGMSKIEILKIVGISSNRWKKLRRAFGQEGLRLDYDRRSGRWFIGRQFGGTLELFETVLRPTIHSFRVEAVNVIQESESAEEAVARLIEKGFNPVEMLMLSRVINEDFSEDVETLLLDATRKLLPELPAEIKRTAGEIRRIARLLDPEENDDRKL